MKVGKSGKITKRKLKNATYFEIDGKFFVFNPLAMHLSQPILQQCRVLELEILLKSS
jgi:hypothetical protein